MNESNDFTSLADFIIPESGTGDMKRVSQLVRILKRSSTLPKVENIYIQSLEDDPSGFEIEPGVSISIGSDFLSTPQAALLCLRYGLEWQIWHKNQPKENYDVRINDLAACMAASKFYQLTPETDRCSISLLPPAIADCIKKLEKSEDAVAEMKKIDFKSLAEFHGEKLPNTDLNPHIPGLVSILAHPVEYMLMSGGDQRLNVDPQTLLNKYGCRPFPRPEAFTFASSTASSISNTAYNRVQLRRIALIKESLAKDLENVEREFAKEIRRGIRGVLQLSRETKIVLGPSGTDISLYIAGIAQALFKKEIVHILVASDETGSGVPMALEGKHFSNTSSQGKEVEKGKLLEGFKAVELKPIRLRKDNGQLKKSAVVDKEVYEAVKSTLEEGKQPILHIIDQSKLGYIAPSESCLSKLEKEFGDAVSVVVDNSQFRMDPEDIRAYLEKGYLMVLTGSKFFTGPPFSGALLIPEKIVRRWSELQTRLPEGLFDYTYRNDWPILPMTENLATGINLGLEMRWYAALAEIRRYYKTPVSLRYLGLELFCHHVDKAIRESEFLEHIQGFNKEPLDSIDLMRMKDRKTIYPFFVKFKDRVLSKEELDKLYQLLNRNLSKEFESEGDEIMRLAGQPCHIGQPVPSVYKDGTPSGVLRINLGSRVISESWKDLDSSMFFKSIEEQIRQIDIIIKKIELLLRYPEKLG